MDLPKEDFEAFWTWFAAHERELADIVAGAVEGRVTDQLDAALKQHNLTLVYDITESPSGAEITFTPEGDPEVARMVDAFVESAPVLSRWVVHSRCQRKPLPQALSFVRALHKIDLSNARLDVRVHNGKYHIRFLHDGLLNLSEDQRFEVAASFLDHAAGESVAMAFVGGVDFAAYSEHGFEMALALNQLIAEAGDVPSRQTTADLPTAT